MLYAPIFTILFFTVCIISMILAIIVLQNNHEASPNRCFFALLISLTLWSAGLGLANIAPDAATSEIWRRVSAVGWGTVYSIILHFVLIFTGKRTLIEKWWFYLLLYLPAVLTVLAFAIPSGLNPSTYMLIRTEFGWVNVSGIADYNFWDWIFLFYYIGYTVTALVLILLWGRKGAEHKIRMQSRAIFISFSAALVIASLTDMLFGNTFAKLPQMAPIVLLIPIITLYRIIKKYSFIVSVPIEKKSSSLRIIFCVILYAIFAFLQIRLSSNVDGFLLFGILDVPTIRGIVTQLQMLIGFYLVLREEKPGFIAAILLNAGIILTSISQIIRTKSSTPLPGTISYLVAIMIVMLISDYKKKTAANIEKIENQRKNLEDSEKKLFRMAYFDSLTGLHNKDWFVDYLNRSIHLARRSATMIGVIFADLDSFKSVNDTMGHSAGDAVLKLMAGRLSQCIRTEDAIARFGGDEFLIMVSNLHDLEELHKITGRIMDVFKTPLSVRDMEHFVTASVGVAVYPEDGEDPEALIKNADIAMYLAKNQGKNKCVFCSSDIKNNIIKNMKLTNNLYRALEKNELFLYYQPQVRAENQEIIGTEALLRWKNEEYGVITPNVFIPMAEQTGLIMPIGLWVFRTACEQLKIFQNCYGKDFLMSVNISLEQLKDADIVHKIRRILSDTGTEASKIQVEITESIAFNQDPFVLQRVKEMKELGISISIDDFGTGYSSLIRLKTFPIDLLKIDIDFVRGISTGSEKDMAIIKSIIQISKNLGIEVLAEGVETEEQFNYLKENECNMIQGYYFYKPMPSNEIEKLLMSLNPKG